MPMTIDERQEFLAGQHVGVIAVDREGSAPLAVPIWYSYEPGGDVVVWTARGSLKERLIREAGRFSLVAQQEALPYKYVSVEGPAEFAEATKDDVRALAARYLPADQVDGFADQAFDDSAILVRMRPQRWLSLDYGNAE